MYTKHVWSALVLVCLGSTAFGQDRIDFAHDVQPIFKANCLGCHGPSQQMAGMRLDQRSSAMKAGTRRIVPGGSANSFVYLKLIGQGVTGLPMPPTGSLRREQSSTNAINPDHARRSRHPCTSGLWPK